MRRFILILPLMIAGPLHAAPFASGDAKAGGKQHAEYCSACHAGKFNGDSSKIYTRSDRKVRNADQLGQRIGTCNAMLGLNLFPEDEANLGAYLNQTFYKFK